MEDLLAIRHGLRMAEWNPDQYFGSDLGRIGSYGYGRVPAFLIFGCLSLSGGAHSTLIIGPGTSLCEPRRYCDLSAPLMPDFARRQMSRLRA